MSNFIIVKHPLISHKITLLRDKNTNTVDFRNNVTEITRLLSYEVFKDLELEKINIETPLMKTTGERLKTKINLYPILRAGQGMVDGVTSLIPNAKIGHIGLYRDEKTLKPVKYLFKTPKIESETIGVILDPILATGGSLIEAVKILHEAGINKLVVIAILASKPAIENIQKKYPQIKVYVSALDEKLNDNGYIVPGLGDAGDRIFGTK